VTATLTDWAAVLARTSVPASMWINGAWSTHGGESYPVVAPRDGSTLIDLPSASASDVDTAVRGARDAFAEGSWSRLHPRERGRILIRWADLIDSIREELAVLIAMEMGKPASMAYDVELNSSITIIRWFGELADKLMDEAPRDRRGAVALITREPVGVVGAITPWNWPVTLAMFKLPAALAAGNSVVLKPAGQTPLSMLRIAELATLAGVPDGVLQVVTGEADAGEALARHEDVDALTFTGSTAVGRRLLTYSGESNGKPVWLELGGKSPNVIFPDANIEDAARTAAWAITFNSGQMCTAGSRLIVHRSIRSQVEQLVYEYFDAVRIGDPLDSDTTMGPLASERHRDSVHREIALGVGSGAHVSYGDVTPPSRDGWFTAPVAFTDVDPDSRLAQHEIFGPVLSIIPFDSDDDALRIANNTRYGLGASIWTSNLSRAHRFSREIDAGTVWVNCFEEGDASVPFGGRKLSGHGSEKGVHGIDKFTNLKTTWIQL
jgi:4-(gamma-glutamylamino)butanal dehydrogenase